MWDGTGARPVENGAILIADGRVQAIGPRSAVDIPPGSTVIDGAGTWIVPGLIDSNVHFFQSGGLYTRPDVLDARRARSYETEVAAVRRDLSDTWKRYLALGVTSVVDLGGPMWNFEVRERANAELVAPRVAAGGPIMSTVARPELDMGDPPVVRTTTGQELLAEVRRQLPRKPNFIKVWLVESKELPLHRGVALVRAAAKEARAAGVRLAVQVTTMAAARAAVGAGADVLVGGIVREPIDDDLIKQVVAHRVTVIPMLEAPTGSARVLSGSWRLSDLERRFGSPSAVASWRELAHLGLANADALMTKSREQLTSEAQRATSRENLRRLVAAGAVVAAGSDGGNIGSLHGVSLHAELAAMRAAGMSNEAVLLAATRDASRVFATRPDVGTLEVGMRADLLVLDGDPLADLANLQRIRYVVKGGSLRSAAEILPPNPEAVVADHVDARGATDPGRLRRTVADDVSVESLDGRDVMRGADALIDAYKGAKVQVGGQIVSGDFVVQLHRTDREGRRSSELAIHQVQNGRITRIITTPVGDLPTGSAKVVQGQLEAYSARQTDRLVSFFAKDFTAKMLVDGRQVWVGVDSFRRSYEKLLMMSSSFTAVAVTRIEAGELTVDHELVFGLTGKRQAVRTVAINVVRNGRIQHLFFLPYESW